MSDSGVDIDDELLELAGAGATDKKRKKRQTPSSKPSASKRRKADISMESEPEDEPESEEDQANAYPLEGKYRNEADRRRLMQMPEIEREDILAERQEEMQRIQDKRDLEQMLKDQGNRNGDPDSVSKAAKRQHAVKGATKEKSRKLDELKAKRKAKGEKKRKKTNSPKRDRSSSPMDMETASESEEDGQITKEQEQQEKFFGKANPAEDPITVDDLNKCRLSRNLIAEHCMSPWFEEYVQGAWVRYLSGNDNGAPFYRICEISNLGKDVIKPYQVNEVLVNQQLELKYGKTIKLFAMDKVSNSKFEESEFDRLSKICASDAIKLPSKKDLEKKAAQMLKLTTQLKTESVVSAMLARKSQLQSSISQGQKTMERSRLTQERTLALRRQEYAEVERIDAQLKELAADSSKHLTHEDSLPDLMARVNERNRKANEDAVRKSELLMVEQKRKARKLATSAAPVPLDPSARLKTVPRTFNAATPSSRPGTPNFGGTPPNVNHGTPLRGVTPTPPSTLSQVSAPEKSQASFESAVVNSIELDLGDF